MIVFNSGEWVVVIDADGRVSVRQLGGPTHHMGRVYNAEVATVSAWEARVPPPRVAVLVSGFEEARKADAMGMPVPDEHPRSLEVGGASMMVTHRELEANLALERVVAELSALASALRAGPPTARLPNPEREQWSQVPADQRRMGLEAPEPTPDAAARAQAAVDLFYAQHLGAVIQRVAARPRPRPAGVPEPPPPPLENVEHTFTCRVSGAAAGTVALQLVGDGGVLVVTAFGSLPVASARVGRSELRALHRQLVAGDARSLWKHEETIAPFYCPSCDGSLAVDQWKIYETSPTRVEGMCPEGHRRRMKAG